jgi:hypothetical protein
MEIFVTPNSCVLRIHITSQANVRFVGYEEQLRIYESIVHILQHPVTKPNLLWSIDKFNPFTVMAVTTCQSLLVEIFSQF